MSKRELSWPLEPDVALYAPPYWVITDGGKYSGKAWRVVDIGPDDRMWVLGKGRFRTAADSIVRAYDQEIWADYCAALLTDRWRKT